MNIKQLSSSKKGQLWLCCGILAVVWIVLIVRFGSAWLSDLPDKKKIANAKKEFEKISKEYEKVRLEDSEARSVRKRYRNLAASAWLVSVDGGVETALRRKISDISEKLDFKLFAGKGKVQNFSDLHLCLQNVDNGLYAKLERYLLGVQNGICKDITEFLYENITAEYDLVIVRIYELVEKGLDGDLLT